MSLLTASKLFYPELFPDVDHCLLFDTDMLVFTDVHELWKNLETIEDDPHALIMMIRTNEAYAIVKDYQICGCIMLQHFASPQE